MANLTKSVFNLYADTGANIIGGEAGPMLTLSNASTGPELELTNIVVSSAATIASARLVEPTISADATTDIAATFTKTVVSGSTAATISLAVASVASGPAIKLAGTAFVSCTSIDFTTAALAGLGAIRVAHTDTDTLGWIPVMPDAAVDAATWE